MNKYNDISVGFSWRSADRTTKRSSWLRDLAIALAIALAASILGMIGDAYAQSRSIQISGNNRTVMVTVPIGKSEDVRTDTSFVDVTVGDPEVADVNPLTDHALSILGKKIGTTRVSVYAEGKKLVGIFDVEVSYNRALGSDPNDELSLGKKYFRHNDYGLAEKHFRRAVEKHPRDAEAWLGLAASCDRLRRFDLADRAYAQAVRILGPTVEILNNQGYSYMLRGDYKRAHAALAAAKRKDPTNKYVQNNLRLLEESYRKGKAIQ